MTPSIMSSWTEAAAIIAGTISVGCVCGYAIANYLIQDSNKTFGWNIPTGIELLFPKRKNLQSKDAKDNLRLG